MKIETILAIMKNTDDWVPKIPLLPDGPCNHLTAGIKQPNGNIVVICTLNLEGFNMNPGRRIGLLRTFQVMAAGFWEHDPDSVVILERTDAPCVIKPD
jgi:hypothetical protein